VGGAIDAYLSKSAKVINLDSGASCTIADFPYVTEESASAMIEDTPVFCDYGETICYGYDASVNQWDVFTTLTEERSFARSSVLSDGTWLVTGGTSAAAQVSSEFYTLETNHFEPSARLPQSLSRHCQVRKDIIYIKR